MLLPFALNGSVCFPVGDNICGKYCRFECAPYEEFPLTFYFGVMSSSGFAHGFRTYPMSTVYNEWGNTLYTYNFPPSPCLTLQADFDSSG